ncbi:ras-GEF domain-containing family member 1B isoform X1 [Prionailurus iriomotensis]
MAKFLAELLGCTLPSKGASPMFESKSHSRVGLKSSTKQKEQQWKLSMYSSGITPVCFTSPLIEKPIGK